MKLSEYFDKCRAAGERGVQRRVAAEIGSTPVEVSQWAAEVRPVPAHYVPALESACNQEVTRADLRPDDWQRIWPELVTSKPTKAAA